MKLTKKDILISLQTENCYRLSVRKKFLCLFSYWIPLTYQETEHSKELPIEFKTFTEAINFVNNIID